MKSEPTSSKGASNVLLSRSEGAALTQGRSLLQIRMPEKPSFDVKKAKIDRHGAGQTSWIDHIASCPVYHPTVEEFNDPLQYIQSIASEAATYGMCKIVSPLVASVPAAVVLTKEKVGFKFTTRTQPMRLPEWNEDDKTTFPMSGRTYSLTLFEKMANRTYVRKFSSAASLPARLVEAEFWTELVSGKTRAVEYACDVEGSAFSTSRMDQLATSKWNLKGFSRLSKSTLRFLESSIPGVTEPMLYIGMLFSMFAWHVEDHNLYSINYHHCGAPKTWYGVPGIAAPAFEKVVQEHVYNFGRLEAAGRDDAFDLLLGKTTMFPSKLLTEHGVPVFRTVQSPGEFVITFPQAYHSGFSHGFNCGEAVNFAMADWLPFGAAACQRYELLNRIPLLSQEELLCKEALALCLNPLATQENSSTDHQSCVKAAFVRLMRTHIHVQSFLKQKGALCITSNAGNVLCAVCRHICYISYTSCNCFTEPRCLNHGKELRACLCGSDRYLFIRENFSELEARVHAFENEDGRTVSIHKASHDILFTASMLPVGELTESQLGDEICPKPIDSLYSCSCDPSVNRDETQSKMCLSMTNTLISAKLEPCSPIQSEFSCILTRNQGQEEESFDREELRLKRQRVLKEFQSDESSLNRPNLEVHHLCARVQNKETDLEAAPPLGPNAIKEINLPKKKEGPSISRLIVRGPAPPFSTDTGKKEDGIPGFTSTDEAQKKQSLIENANPKGLKASLFDPSNGDYPAMTCLNSKRENDDAGPVHCDLEVEAGPSLESGLKKGFIIRLKVKQSKTSFSTVDNDILQNEKDEKKNFYVLESVSNYVADLTQAGSVTSWKPDQGGWSSLSEHGEVGWLPNTQQTSVASFSRDMGTGELKDDSTTFKVEQFDLLEDDPLEEGELKEPSSILDYAASTPHVNDKPEEYCNHSQKASNFREHVPPPSFSADEMKSSGIDVDMESCEVAPVVNEEQKLWQAEYSGNTSPTPFQNEMLVSHYKHVRWHHQRDVLSQQVLSTVCPDMARPSDFCSLDCSQPFSDFLFTGFNSKHLNENLHQRGKMWVPNKYLDKIQDQRRWYSGHRSKTTPVGKEVGSCKRWWGPPGSYFAPSSSAAQNSAHFFTSDRRTRSKPVRNCNGSRFVINRNALPFRTKSFHHHHHREPKRATFTPLRQPHFSTFEKRRQDAHFGTRQPPHKQLFRVNKDGAQGFQSSPHNRL